MGDGESHGDAVRLLTVGEAAQWAGVTRHTIKGWITKGRLPAELVDHRRRIRLADLVVAQATVHVGAVVPRWQADRQRAGQRLRALREAAGYSQQHLAARSGVTHEEVSRLERSERTPTAATVRALAQALGVTPERFVAYEPIGLTMLTVPEAASRLDVPAGRVRKWLQQGELGGTKVSGRWRIPAIAVAELARSGRLRGRSRRLDPRYRGDARAW
jgi:excisionase family DNA binding protein